MKLFIALLTSMLLITTANAESHHDIGIKKQCQYLVYGNGVHSSEATIYMNGIIIGIISMIPKEDATDFGMKSDTNDIKYKACQRALVNTEAFGFRKLYMIELIGLLKNYK